MLVLKMYAFSYDSMNMGCVEHRNGKTDPSTVLLHCKHYCSSFNVVQDVQFLYS